MGRTRMPVPVVPVATVSVATGIATISRNTGIDESIALARAFFALQQHLPQAFE
jgi:hypothetical protein